MCTLVTMSIIKAIEMKLKKFSERRIGETGGGSHFITIPKWGSIGQTVVVEVKDENTLIVSKNKELTLE